MIRATLGRYLSDALLDAPIEVYAQIDSTKEEARRRAQSNTHAVWLLAHEQTQGQGRRGRIWRSPVGNLALTGLIPHAHSAAELTHLSLVAALAAYDLAEIYISNPKYIGRLGLKWPNDLLLDGHKLAGLLLEAGRGVDRQDWVSISIGMNLVAAPAIQDIGQRATCLAEVCSPPDPLTAAKQFAICLRTQMNILDQYGFMTIRERWLDRATGLGQCIRVQQAKETLNGIFEGLADDGSLILRDSCGNTHTVTAGDIHFGYQ